MPLQHLSPKMMSFVVTRWRLASVEAPRQSRVWPCIHATMANHVKTCCRARVLHIKRVWLLLICMRSTYDTLCEGRAEFKRQLIMWHLKHLDLDWTDIFVNLVSERISMHSKTFCVIPCGPNQTLRRASAAISEHDWGT